MRIVHTSDWHAGRVWKGVRRHDELTRALDGLLGAARASGDVRADVTSSDILLAIALMCQPIPNQDLHVNERIIHIFIEGLRHS